MNTTQTKPSANGHAKGVPPSNRRTVARRLPEARLPADRQTIPNAQVVSHPTTAPSRQTASARKPISKWLVAIIVAATLIAAMLFVAANWRSAAGSDVHDRVGRALPVDVARVALSDSYEISRSYSGEVVARRRSNAGFELRGKLVRVHVGEGDRVATGDVLARLDTDHLETKRRQLVAHKAQAEAVLEELLAGPRVEAIAAARAQVKSLYAQADLLRIQVDRATQLLPKNAISRDEYDEVTHNYQARRAELENARHRLQELLNGTRKEQIRAQRAAVQQAAAAIDDVDVDLGKSTLRASYSGTIASRFVDEGTVVEAGMPIVELVEDSKLEAWIGVPPRLVPLLEIGSRHTITVDGVTIPATVSGLVPAIDPATQTRTVIFPLESASGQQPVDGQIARIELTDTVHQRGSWIPASAIGRDARGLWTGFVLSPLKENRRGDEPADSPRAFELTRHYLEVLHMQADRVYVRGTFTGGERIVADGVHRLVAGQHVRIVNELD